MDRVGLEHLSWELSVLCRALAYPNLSAAASHVGLSQPQLSRIVLKLEAELEIVLLDRSSKRRSSWTPLAPVVAETFQRSMRKMKDDFERVVRGHLPKRIHIGTLEGLSTIACHVATRLLALRAPVALTTAEVHVYDLSQLEGRFFSGEIDLIFSSRDPGRKKFSNRIVLGHQTMVPHASKGVHVLSSYEHEQLTSKKSAGAALRSGAQALVSNSLAVRRHWLKTYGGVGELPSDVKPGRGNEKSDRQVVMIGASHFHPALWKSIEGLKL